MLLLAALFALQCPDGAPPPCRVRPAPVSIAIAEFANRSGDTSDAYLAHTIADDVASLLASARGVRLISTRGRGADYTLSGSVRREGDRLTVRAQLERPASRQVVWRLSLVRPVSDLGRIPDTVATGALRAVGLRPAPAARRREDPVLYDLYARGRYQLFRRTQQGVNRAYELFGQALAVDSTFALGWTGLVETYERANRWQFTVPGVPRDSMFPREIAFSERALELDPNNSQVWVIRGRVLADVDPTSRTGTLRAVRRAIELDSSNAAAWQLLGLTLEELGDRDGALAAFRRAITLPRPDIESINFIALHYIWWRQIDSAVVVAESALALEPTYVLAREVAGHTALMTGRLQEAEAHYDAAQRLATPPDIRGLAGLAQVAVARGDSARARVLVAQAEAQTDSLRPSVHSSHQIAEVYAALGEVDRALLWLERYQPRRDLHFRLHLLREPAFDRMRAHPRFQALLQ